MAGRSLSEISGYGHILGRKMHETDIASTSHAAIDWERISQWSSGVANGDLGEIRNVFGEHGAEPPELFWEPPTELLPPILGFLRRFQMDNATTNAQLHIAAVDPLQLRPALGFVNLLDVIDGGRDFRYRLYGTSVALVSGFDMTGKLLSEFPARPYVIEFNIAVDRASWRLKRCAYTRRCPQGAEDVLQWHRLSVPLVDDNDAVVRMMIGAVPVQRADKRSHWLATR